MNKRKIILNLAMSLDGFIADENWWFDWIIGDGDTSQDTEKKMDFDAFMETIDIVVMGKKAYIDCPKETMNMVLKNKKIYVATHREIEKKASNVTCIEWDISQLIWEVLKLPWKNIFLWGGAIVADSFIKSNMIDEYVVGIIPTILGKWRPLFLTNNPTIKLHLTEITSQQWIVVLKYTKR